jgi:hypothetical protein
MQVDRQTRPGTKNAQKFVASRECNNYTAWRMRVAFKLFNITDSS